MVNGNIKTIYDGLFKGQCHEDFALLYQFWAKIITLRLYLLTKCFCKATTKISNEFYQRGLLNHTKFLEGFLKMQHQKFDKIGSFCSNFNAFSSLPFEATGDRKQFWYLFLRVF